MALHPSQNPYYCKHCDDLNPKYNIDFRCEECLNLVYTKERKHYDRVKEVDDE